MKREIECRTYSMREAAQILGLGRNHTYGAIDRGEIPALRFGRRIVVPKDALDEILENPSTARGFSTTRLKPWRMETAGLRSRCAE